MLGTVISVSLETSVKKKDGGSYKGWELVYKSDDGDVRTIAKPVTGLTYNQPLKKALSELSAGDQFTLEQEKNAGGFNDVKSIRKGWAEGQPPLPSAASASKASSAPSNSYQARDFETKEERTIKQRLIVRQSSLSTAVDILSVGAKVLKKEDVLGLAETLFDWVYETKASDEKAYDEDVPY